jgi:hypothetical protein
MWIARDSRRGAELYAIQFERSHSGTPAMKEAVA